MQGFTDLTKSERGILTLVLVLAVTILVVLDKVTGADWLAYTKWIAVTLIASKTLTGAITTYKTGQPPTGPA